MNLPRYKAGPVEYWLGEAITVFINGAIRGSLGGAMLGAGGGTATGTTSLGNGMTPETKFYITVGLFLGGMIANGWKSFVVWHDQHEFPNPWPAPTGTTNPPFAGTPPASQ